MRNKNSPCNSIFSATFAARIPAENCAPPDAGKRAIVMGWVHRRRDLGRVIFIHLRDRDGVTQIVFDEGANAGVHDQRGKLGSEYVIAVEGRVELRTPDTINATIPTGEVEVRRREALDSERIAHAAVPDGRERGRQGRRAPEVSLRRSAPPAHAAQYHHALEDRVRRAAGSDAQGFLEIETPFMTRSTPEGARDYLVPSRVQPGTFYALPQSPQIFKQLLMVSGFDKYFQIVRCFRDEDLRADRQPEFTQIDLEMSFPQQEQIYEVIEPLICSVSAKWPDTTSRTPFPRITYAEAMRSYGSDKPDLRLPPFHCVEDSVCGRRTHAARPAAGGDPHSEDRPAQPQGARRAEGVRPGARAARLRRHQAPGARFPDADGQSPRAHAKPPKTIC